MTDKKPTLAEQLAAQGYVVKPCKGCGKSMVWGKLLTGSWMPLDPVPPVYTIVPMKGQDGYSHPEAVRTMLAFVSHFVTCPDRDKFSGGKR